MTVDVKRFHYNALTLGGELVQGELAAADASVAIAQLNEQALLPIDASEIPAGQIKPARLSLRKAGPLSGSDLALVSQQLSRLLKAGLSLDRALAIVVDLSNNRSMRQCLQSALERVRDGGSLGEAMAMQGKSFPDSFVTLVRAGELSGALQAVLAEAATFLSRSEAMRQKVVSAMVYPIILIVVASLSVGVILTAVLPQFEPMFREAGAKLPFLTQIIVAAGGALRHYWWLLLVFGVGAAIASQLIVRSPQGKSLLDELVLSVPLIGHLVVRLEVARFCRTLGAMLANGVAGTTALTLAVSALSNVVLSRAAEAAAIRYREGEGLSVPLSRSGRFPLLAIQLIRIGEETGRLEEMLAEVATLFDEQVQRLLERLLAALVPALTLAMGLVIAVIVGAVMTALMSVNALAT